MNEITGAISQVTPRSSPASRIAIVGEAWGAEEARLQRPFIGASGHELTRMLNEAGISRFDCFLTNVFNLRPKPTDDIKNLCGDRSKAIPGRGPIPQGGFIRAEFAPQLDRLTHELIRYDPTLIIALGNTAVWFLLGSGNISKVRGTIALSPFGKTIATYHPAAVLREWSLRSIAVADFIKARRESEFPEVRRPKREIWIEPSLSDMEVFYAQFIEPSPLIAVDIETIGTEITCVGFAPTKDRSLVIPFFDPRRANGSYWPTLDDEFEAWKFVRRVLTSPARKLYQNGMYDTYFFIKWFAGEYLIPDEDTMLLHHSLFPEFEKSLGFLGSIYTDEPAWKLMRARGKTTIKRDE